MSVKFSKLSFLITRPQNFKSLNQIFFSFFFLQFQFIAKSYYSSGADIAIDDIELQNCNFPGKK